MRDDTKNRIGTQSRVVTLLCALNITKKIYYNVMLCYNNFTESISKCMYYFTGCIFFGNKVEIGEHFSLLAFFVE